MFRVNKILETAPYKPSPETREDIDKNIEVIREHEQRKNTDVTQSGTELSTTPTGVD